MSRTSNALNRARQPFGATLWGYLFGLAKAERRTMYRRVTKTVVTSDSAGGLCDHPTQPGLDDCGWGVKLESLTLRQARSNESAWEVVERYLEADEKVLAVLKDWADLEALEGELDARLALEIKLYRDERDYALRPRECPKCKAKLGTKVLCVGCDERAQRRWIDLLREVLGDDDEDDDSWF